MCEDEPFKKLINQGKIQGRSSFVYRDKSSGVFISKGLIEGKDVSAIHVDISMVENDVLDMEAFKKWRPELNDAKFQLEGGKYLDVIVALERFLGAGDALLCRDRFAVL